ncbi:MAG: helix-turn-helix domain-containing protein, partial [Pseudonocardia sp.]|nr:helix-turn-helix domain-containing protein [Pseudonocardia sp.]
GGGGVAGGGGSAGGGRWCLLAANAAVARTVAAEVGCSKQTVITWRERFRTEGVAGLKDAPRSGRPVSVDPVAVIERTLQAPPPRLRARRWSSRLMAAELGVSNVAVANIWRRWGVVPLAGGRVRLATEPPLESTGPVVAVHVGPGLGIAALGTDGRGDAARVPWRDRPRLGDRFDRLDLGEEDGASDLDGFLESLDALRPLRLLVTATPTSLEDWAATRGVPVHVVPPGLAWVRLVRIAVVLAGGTERGAAAVAELRQAVLDHVPGGPLRWHHSTAANDRR